MIERVEEFHKEFVALIENVEGLRFATRAKELQVEAIAQLQSFKAKAKELKAEKVAEGIEDLANRMLSYEQTLQALIQELRMWVALKEDKSDEAWDALIDAQIAARIAVRAHNISRHLWVFIKRLHALEKLLFPPVAFMSVGVLIKHSTCSICDSDYGDCDHLKGKVYMGEICGQVVRDAKLLEVSIVPKPADKHCRILQFTDNGVTRDVLTWRVIPTQAEKD